MNGISINYPFHSNKAALKKIAVCVQMHLIDEHDERYDGEMIERAVVEWFAREVDILLADGVELLTVPRYGHALALRQRLDELNVCNRKTTERISLRQAA